MMTITEALAELKTLKARVEKKQQFVLENVVRPGVMVDPMAKEGGQEARVTQERQAVRDILKRMEAIRLSIMRKNLETELEVLGEKRSVQGWLTWRRDIQPLVVSFTKAIADRVRQARQPGMWKQVNFQSNEDLQKFLAAVVVNVSELEVQKDWERMEEIMGTLDGKLSLHNATNMIEV